MIRTYCDHCDEQIEKEEDIIQVKTTVTIKGKSFCRERIICSDECLSRLKAW